MHVSSLSLRDFRNHISTDIEPGIGPVVFIGSNGQGKTNLVEAINYLATLCSHRISSDIALIRQGSEAAIIRVSLAHENRTILLEVQLNKSGKNKAQEHKSLQDLLRSKGNSRDVYKDTGRILITAESGPSLALCS